MVGLKMQMYDSILSQGNTASDRLQGDLGNMFNDRLHGTAKGTNMFCFSVGYIVKREGAMRMSSLAILRLGEVQGPVPH